MAKSEEPIDVGEVDDVDVAKMLGLDTGKRGTGEQKGTHVHWKSDSPYFEIVKRVRTKFGAGKLADLFGMVATLYAEGEVADQVTVTKILSKHKQA